MQQACTKRSFPALICAVLLALLSCSKTNNPKKDESIPPAIRVMISENNNCFCEPFIEEYKWRGQIVYLRSCRGPLCNCTTVYYDADGQQITMPTGYMPDAFFKEARLLREVWRCKK